MTDRPDPTLANAEGAWAQQAEANLGDRRLREEIERGLSFGLEAAPTINDRTISTFVRGEMPHFAGERGTFLKCPFIEDVNQVDDAEVAVFGVPLDAGTTYRPGTRFGPQGIRRSTNLFGTYSYESGVDLREQLNIVDIGDVFTIPGNIEKSFDQISQAIAHVAQKGVFPVVLGGDHSIGFPTIRGLAPYMDGNLGIIHFDRHVDTQETDLDERMHTTPWFHATNIKQRAGEEPGADRHRRLAGPREGVKVGRERGTTIMTVGDVERVGIEKIAEMALEIAWKGAKAVYLSFDIDVIDAGFVPGTGWPEPGGLLPREALKLIQLVAEPGLAGIEVVECSPPYDWAEQTALMSSRVILDSLAAQVRSGKLGNKAAVATTVPPGGRSPAVLGWSPCAWPWHRSAAAPTRRPTSAWSRTTRDALPTPARGWCCFPRRRCAGSVSHWPRSPNRWTARGRRECDRSPNAQASSSSPACSSPPIRSEGRARVTNTLIATGPGVDAHYDKIHLYDAFGFTESNTVAPGQRARGDHGRRRPGTREVGLTLCYDVRFPELYVELARRGAQLITVHASWGTGPGKLEQWTLLARARAIDTTRLHRRSRSGLSG